MLSRTEYVAIRAALVRLAGNNVAAIADEIEALDWVIRAEDDIAEIKTAGGFRSPQLEHRRHT